VHSALDVIQVQLSGEGELGGADLVVALDYIVGGLHFEDANGAAGTPKPGDLEARGQVVNGVPTRGAGVWAGVERYGLCRVGQLLDREWVAAL